MAEHLAFNITIITLITIIAIITIINTQIVILLEHLAISITSLSSNPGLLN